MNFCFDNLDWVEKNIGEIHINKEKDIKKKEKSNEKRKGLNKSKNSKKVIND